MFSSQIYRATFVNHRCTGGFTYFALHFIHATFCIEPRKMNLIKRLLLDNYEVMHTQSLKHVGEDVVEALKNWEAQEGEKG